MTQECFEGKRLIGSYIEYNLLNFGDESNRIKRINADQIEKGKEILSKLLGGVNENCSKYRDGINRKGAQTGDLCSNI